MEKTFTPFIYMRSVSFYLGQEKCMLMEGVKVVVGLTLKSGAGFTTIF